MSKNTIMAPLRHQSILWVDMNDCKLLILLVPGAELNRRHTDFQSVALPTELPRHMPLKNPVLIPLPK